MNLSFRICTDMIEAEQIWKQLCPQENLYDCWEFRATFQKYLKKELHFIVGEINSTLVGAWPLQIQAGTGALEFFGGDYMEGNRLLLAPAYATDPMVITAFFDHLKNTGAALDLQLMSGTHPIITELPVQDYKFVLPVNGYAQYTDYLEAVFSSETRKTLLKKMRRVERENISVVKNNFPDIEKLFEYNIAMFGEFSSFTASDRPFQKEIFRDLIGLPNLTTQLLTFQTPERVMGVSIAWLYNGCYGYALTGIDPQGIKDLSTYVNLINIQNAIELKAHSVDCFTGAYGWKDRWHFSKIPQYRLGTIPLNQLVSSRTQPEN